MNLRDKYDDAIRTAKNIGMQGEPEERDGRLHFTGTVASEVEKNAILDAVKRTPGWREDVVDNLEVRPRPGVDAPVSTMKTYTVQPGDTLGSIARAFLGRASEDVRLLDANRDQLQHAEDLTPGQVLKIPSLARQLT